MSSIDVEREAAALVSDDDGLSILYREGVRPEHFFDSSLRDVYAWSIDYFSSHGMMKEAPSQSIVRDAFPFYSDAIRGTKGLKATFVAEEMKKKFARKMTEDVVKGVMMSLSSDPVSAVSALVEGGTAILGMNTRKSDCIVYGQDDVLQDAWYTERHSVDFLASGAPFPLKEMHEWTGGIRKGEVWPFVAETGTGKTWFACAMALSAARAGWNVYFAELEMGVPEIAERIDVIAAGSVSPVRYDRGELLPAEKATVRDARRKVAGYPGKIVIETPGRRERSVQSLLSRARAHDADLVIIDQLQFIRRAEGVESRTVQIEDIVGELKESVSAGGGESRMSVLLPAQFNREKSKSGGSDFLGDTHFIALSAAVEQIADGIISIGRSKEMEFINQMNIGLLKFRRGPKAAWELTWNLSTKFDIHVNRPLEQWGTVECST